MKKIRIIFMALVSGTLVFLSGCGDNQETDPNRTQKDCSVLGTAKVYPAWHDSGSCIPDADGYYHMTFGHHHHK